MPMTLAHPAVVLPLRRAGFPLSALAIGSMTPDLPVFVQDWGFYHFTHGLIGIVTFDLAVALATLLVWDRIVRDALVDLSPDAVRLRLPARRRLSWRAWALAAPAAVLGSLSHVVWDAFTHPGRWGQHHVTWLAEEHGPLLGLQWAQHVSGIAGMTVLLVYAGAQLPGQRSAPDRPRRLPAITLPLLLGCAAASALVAGLSRRAQGIEVLAFHGAVGGIVGGAVALLVGGLAWRLAGLRRRMREVAPGHAAPDSSYREGLC